MAKNGGTPRRPRYPMPAFIRLALTREALMDAYKFQAFLSAERLHWWITRAIREETRAKRLKQMLDE